MQNPEKAQNNTEIHKSIIEQYLPKYRRAQQIEKQPEEQEILNYKQLAKHVSITTNRLQEIFNNRMSTHEDELTKIFRQQIESIMSDLAEVVRRYNQLIIEKSINKELLRTRNQLDYFRYQSVKLFEENKRLRRQIKQLKLKQFLFNTDLQAKQEALRNLNYKLEKQKSLKNHYKREMSQEKLAEAKNTRKNYPANSFFQEASKITNRENSLEEKQIRIQTNNQSQRQELSERIRFPILFSKSVENKYRLKSIKQRKSTEINEISTNEKSKILDTSQKVMRHATLSLEKDRPLISKSYQIIKEHEKDYQEVSGRQNIILRTPKMKKSAQVIKYKLSLPRNL